MLVVQAKNLLFSLDYIVLKQSKPQLSAQQSQKNMFFEDFENNLRDWHGIHTTKAPAGHQGTAIKAIPIDNQWFGCDGSL